MKLEEIKAAVGGRGAEKIEEGELTRAAVLVPLVERNGALSVLFEERSSLIPQGGEICFPGGHVERGESFAEAAVRETSEELLLPRERIELLAPLHILDAAGRREIHSFLGVLHGYADTWAPDEVARCFPIPLEWFLRHPPEIHVGKTVLSLREDFPYDLIPGGKQYGFATARQRFYFYRTEQGVIWGLTAKLLYHFLDLLR